MVERISPADRRVEEGQVPGLVREVAISGGGIYSSILTTPPGLSTRIHHHGHCETSIYIVSGRARFTWGPTGTENEMHAQAGDFVHVPPEELHVEENASDSDDLVVVVSRNCPENVTIYP